MITSDQIKVGTSFINYGITYKILAIDGDDFLYVIDILHINTKNYKPIKWTTVDNFVDYLNSPKSLYKLVNTHLIYVEEL